MRDGHTPSDGRNIHDAAWTTLLESRERRRDESIRSPKMNVHCLLKIFFHHEVQRGDEHDSRVVDEDVDTAILMPNRGDSLFHVLVALHVARPGCHLGA